MQTKKEIGAPSFKHLFAGGQLLIQVGDAVSPSIRYLWYQNHILFIGLNVGCCKESRKKHTGANPIKIFTPLDKFTNES